MSIYQFDDTQPLSAYEIDLFYMKKAYELAQQAFEEDEVPIGALVVCQNKIIGKGYNLTERLNDVTAHAEMLAFTAAADALGGKYLTGCTLYVTVEPCIMCAGASYWTQISRIVFGTGDSKRGFSSVAQKILHPKTECVSGVMAEECSQLMKQFFEQKRK